MPGVGSGGSCSSSSIQYGSRRRSRRHEAQRPPVGTRLELFDGAKALRVTVPSQVLGPPMTVVDVDPGQADSASSLGFLGMEVLMRPAR